MKDWTFDQQVFRESTLRWKREPSIICDHTTEGSDYPSAATYRGGASAPHVTTHPRKRTTRQHYPYSRPAFALQAPAGISTNTMGVIQVEIVGTCEDRLRDAAHSVYSFSSGDLQYLADVHGKISEATGIPLTTSVEWKPYPASYGARNGVRLSPSAFYNYRGVLGHQHVPGNTHGDPGNWIPDMLALARGEVTKAEVILPRGVPTMLLIQAPDRGIGIVDGGFYRAIPTMEEVQSYIAAGVPEPKVLNNRQYDVIVAGLTNSSTFDGNQAAFIQNNAGLSADEAHWLYNIYQGLFQGGESTPDARSVFTLLDDIRKGAVPASIERLSDADVDKIVDRLAARLGNG